MRQSYIEVTQEAGRAIIQRNLEGPVVMLNLLRFREVADYSDFPHLDPGEEISGRGAYQRYIDHTLPYLLEAGSEILFSGEAGAYLIGPAEVHWDQVLLVRHSSVADFMAFARNEGYLKGAGHRTAALADARLLPIAASV